MQHHPRQGHQQMSVQGPLTRTVADARLALQVMSRGSALDPQWVPAPLENPDCQKPMRVAVFKNWTHSKVDRSVSDAVAQAASLAQSGDAVLMSPACASFDMFDNYGHRAEVFVQAVASLAEAAGVAMEGGL